MEPFTFFFWCPQFDHKISGSLKKELEIIIPQLEVMKKRKIERKDQLFSVLDQLQRLSTEISRSLEDNLYKMVVEETDLSLKRLEELHRQLLEYQDEKVLYTLELVCSISNLLSCSCWKIHAFILKIVLHFGFIEVSRFKTNGYDENSII